MLVSSLLRGKAVGFGALHERIRLTGTDALDDDRAAVGRLAQGWPSGE